MPRPVRTTRLMLVALANRVPMVRLAQLLGLSDVGLAKVYQRDWIEHATRGHWARREHGKDVPPIRLRGSRASWREVVEFGANAKDRDDGRRDDDLIDLLRRDADAPATELARDLRNAHPLVRRGASAALRRPVLGEESPPGVAADAITEVPRSQLVRARKLIDGLTRALEARRIRVRPDRRRTRPEPELVILGIRFRLRVTYQRAAPGGDAVLLEREGSRSRERELMLHAELVGARSGSYWGGRWQRRIDGRIDEIVANLVAMAVEERERRWLARGGEAPEEPAPPAN